MKKTLLSAALAAVMAFAPGCAPDAAGGGSTASGSIGISRDDALLFAADPDLDTLFVVDAKTQAVVSEIKVGRQPEKVLVGPDDTVYVTNRLDRSVSVIRAGDTQESARIPTAVEPVGLAASSDGKTLYVVNATSLTDAEFGTLMAFDTATLQLKWETPVGHEPRGITLMGDGKAAISLYKRGDLVMVDLAQGRVTKSGTGVFDALNASALGIVSTGTSSGGGAVPFPAPEPSLGGPQTSRPMGLEALTVSPDGEQVYVVSLIATDTVLNTSTPTQEPIRGGSSGYGGGSCGSTAVAAPAILTFDAEGRALVDDVRTCQGDSSLERPPMVLTSPLPGVPLQGPKAVTLDPTGSFLFVANMESNNVAIVPTSSRGSFDPSVATRDIGVGPGFGGKLGSVSTLVNVGSGPTGIVVSHDGKKAYVFNSFDHSISRLEEVNDTVSNVGTTKLTTRELLSPAAVAGRKLFFSASDARMNDPSMGISCATCHLEGREDGHVWNFPDGPRQTPSLQGRMLAKTAPFHWNGEFTDLMAFMTHTVTNRMGGSGVTPTMEQQVAAFIAEMPAADNPHTATPADVMARGKAAFDKAECGSCHGTETFTDNTFADVGTFVRTGPVVDDPRFLPHGGLNTPSLLGLARTAPYLHDGSALTLKARIMVGKEADKHGKTSGLSDAEVDDLVAYLKAL